jgi:hypothetical protein
MGPQEKFREKFRKFRDALKEFNKNHYLIYVAQKVG